MEVFLKKLVSKSDLSVLTKRMIREEYKKHVGRDHLEVEEKTELSRLVTNLLENLMSNNEAAVQRGEDDDNQNEKENDNPTFISGKGLGENSKNVIHRSSPKKLLTPWEKPLTPSKKETNKKVHEKVLSSEKKCSPNKLLQKSPLSATDSESQSNTSKLRVDEVLDAVMNSDVEDDLMSESGESEEDEEEVNSVSEDVNVKTASQKFKKYHLVEEDDEDTWKPFTPVKETKPVKGRIESSSDDVSQYSSDDGKKSKRCAELDRKFRKASKKRSLIISSDEESASESWSENSDNEKVNRKSHQVSTSASKRRKLNSDKEKKSSKKGNSKPIKSISSTDEKISTKVKKPQNQVTKMCAEKGKKTSSNSKKGKRGKSPIRKRKAQVSSDSSSSEEEMPLAVIRRNSKAESSTSDSDEGLSLANLRKKSEEQTGSEVDSHNSGLDEESPVKLKKSQSRKKPSKEESTSEGNQSSTDSEAEESPVKPKPTKCQLKKPQVMDSDESGSEEEEVQQKKKKILVKSSKKKTTPAKSARKNISSKASESVADDKSDQSSEDDEVEAALTKSKVMESDSESGSGSDEDRQMKNKTTTPVKSSKKRNPQKKARKKNTPSKESDTESDSDEASEDEKSLVTKSEEVHKTSDDESDSAEDSADSIENATSLKTKPGNGGQTEKDQKDSSSNSDSSLSDDEPVKPSKIGKGGRKSGSSEKPKSKSKLGVRKRESHVTKLRKICREAGIFIRSNRELEGCKTDAHIVRRIKQILEKHGMKGRPNMKKAKKIRLKKEAAELDTDNIISNGQARPKRRVNSLFSRNSPSRMKDFTPPRVKFGHLKDIIESEESD